LITKIMVLLRLGRQAIFAIAPRCAAIFVCNNSDGASKLLWSQRGVG